jgi:hypothetical protein
MTTWQLTRDLDDYSAVEQITAYDEDEAVEEYCRLNFSNWDYPKEITVYLRQDPAEDWREFEVEVQATPTFLVTEV